SSVLTVAGYGSYGYMSPEQEAGEAASPADDVYALGVMMWQMVRGTVVEFPQYPDDIAGLKAPAQTVPTYLAIPKFQHSYSSA
ncbi:hypothetical protein TI04_13840, partial [Achromatium sp. WMS2]